MCESQNDFTLMGWRILQQYFQKEHWGQVMVNSVSSLTELMPPTPFPPKLSCLLKTSSISYFAEMMLEMTLGRTKIKALRGAGARFVGMYRVSTRQAC